MTLNCKSGNEQGHNIPMELPFLRQEKQEVNDVLYLDHLLFVIRELHVRTAFCGELLKQLKRL